MRNGRVQCREDGEHRSKHTRERAPRRIEEYSHILVIILVNHIQRLLQRNLISLHISNVKLQYLEKKIQYLEKKIVIGKI